MSFTVITTTRKPANAKWWADTAPHSHPQWVAFVATLPGIVSSVARTLPNNSNIMQSEMVFTSQAAALAYHDATKKRFEWQARKAYNLAKGITSTVVYRTNP
jgi:hypothetical protein